ncbi:hypothetical protein D6D12_03183 [Aureobasidium pullulans]|uniref:PAC domain-containing protein n=1 Tax=Aureobasidium pullulans TaxID=5580 RepID=A0AB74JZR1_AURPU|nr:hypothetical protein D6D12_03183 [Aureobasidium pullulans]THX35239.1 hypothetical protein D6D11_09596 [Aureobasidium pullulans]
MPSTRAGSISPVEPSIFDPVQEEVQDDYHTEPTTAPHSGSGDEHEYYDLKPPPPSVTHSNMEHLSMRFFSVDHLNIILRDYQLSARFHRFLTQYKPYILPAFDSYVDTQKAVAAIEYANSLANSLPSLTGDIPRPAAVMDESFQERSKMVVQELVDDALPAYITHRLVTVVTDSLVKEITGNNAPIMRELIPSLAEVYCITDPSIPDNPIVYASEGTTGFYDISGYQKDFVIGRNCRFLQGPKTSSSSVHRLIEAIRAGQEVTETMLNYRRDGIPFMNLLMIAPLYDNKGNVRYYLGAQIDVTHLIEGGKGLESFEKLLANDRIEERYRGRSSRIPTQVLGELGAMMNKDELDAVNTRQRSESRESTSAAGSARNVTPARPARRVLGMDDSLERTLWPHPSLGPSGRLPGVYQNYLLVRPYPSLRITFTSPALRIPGLLQTKLMDRLGGPQDVRDGVLDSLAHGTAVTAKISWLSTPTTINTSHRTSIEGKPRWIHCTPMLGSDEKVGVWMIVMVEQETVTGSLRRPSEVINTFPSPPANVIGGRESLDIPVRGGEGARSPRFKAETGKLYAEYLRREGKSPPRDGGAGGTPSRGSSMREARPFQEF